MSSNKELSRDFPTQISIQEAMRLLFMNADVLELEEIPLIEVYGRVLGKDILSKENVPPFDRSPYDGYAFRASDIAGASEEEPVTLSVIAEVAAGHAAGRALEAGEAVRIMTGAPVPAGADTIVKYEDTEFTERTVTFMNPVREGVNIVKAGEDIKEGEIVISAGTKVTAADAGLLASLGYAHVPVFKKPRVKIISTGDELLSVFAPRTEGKIRNSSAYMLKGFLDQWGMDAEIFGIVPDDENEIATALIQCVEYADIVITTGGASVGDYDLTLSAIRKIEAELLFWKVKMKPGMATMAGMKNGKLILGLSGNPSAAAAALFLLARPAFYKMAGRDSFEPTMLTVTLPDGFDRESPMGRILPGVLEFRDGKICLGASKGQGNGMISNWSGCNLIGLIPRGSGAIEAGGQIEAMFYEND